MPCFCGKLPHQLDIEDFDDERPNSMPLTDWIINWVGGWGDEAVDRAEIRAIKAARKMIGLKKSDVSLRILEELLSPEQRYDVWCEIFEIKP